MANFNSLVVLVGPLLFLIKMDASINVYNKTNARPIENDPIQRGKFESNEHVNNDSFN